MHLPWLPVVGAIGLAASSLASAADSFTVGVLACAAETDRDRRVDCYDRAVANYTAGLTRGHGVAPPVTPSATPAAAIAAPTGPGTTSVQPAGALASASATPSAAAAANAPAAAAATAQKAVPTLQRHVAAHIVSIEHFPDHVLVHLDNQQTWKQTSDSPGGPLLRNGEAVTIDKQMGSWWLAGPTGESVQVRLEGPNP